MIKIYISLAELKEKNITDLAKFAKDRVIPGARLSESRSKPSQAAMRLRIGTGSPPQRSGEATSLTGDGRLFTADCEGDARMTLARRARREPCSRAGLRATPRVIRTFIWAPPLWFARISVKDSG